MGGRGGCLLEWGFGGWGDDGWVGGVENDVDAEVYDMAHGHTTCAQTCAVDN